MNNEFHDDESQALYSDRKHRRETLMKEYERVYWQQINSDYITIPFSYAEFLEYRLTRALDSLLAVEEKQS